MAIFQSSSLNKAPLSSADDLQADTLERGAMDDGAEALLPRHPHWRGSQVCGSHISGGWVQLQACSLHTYLDSFLLVWFWQDTEYVSVQNLHYIHVSLCEIFCKLKYPVLSRQCLITEALTYGWVELLYFNNLIGLCTRTLCSYCIWFIITTF